MAVTATYTRRKPEEGILYNAVCQEWPKIRAASKAANDGHGLPDFIEDAVDDYRKCGDLKHGFVHVQCCSCKESLVIAFSCKQTGLCNSCDGKRMVSLGAHMVDEIIPKVRMRQWVITFPYDIRFLLAWNSVIQRMDQQCKLFVHWHILCAEGTWCETAKGPKFEPAPPLKQHVVQQVFEDVLKRIDRQIAKLPDPIEEPGKFMKDLNPALSALLNNAMLGRQTSGKDAGKPQKVEFGKGPQVHNIKPHGRNCCEADGYSLHANRTVARQDREGLEKLCKYLCRPAVPADRLEMAENPVGNRSIRIKLKTVKEGGITSVLVSPQDLVIRALAQIPLPFRKAVRYHGAFGGNSKIRPDVVPDGQKKKTKRKKAKACGMKDESTKLTWEQALRRAFGWEVLNCLCGGKRIVLAVVQKKVEIERFLRHLHLWPGAGDVLSVCGPPELFDFAEIELESNWNDFYDLQSKQAADADWAA